MQSGVAGLHVHMFDGFCKPVRARSEDAGANARAGVLREGQAARGTEGGDVRD